MNVDALVKETVQSLQKLKSDPDSNCLHIALYKMFFAGIEFEKEYQQKELERIREDIAHYYANRKV